MLKTLLSKFIPTQTHEKEVQIAHVSTIDCKSVHVKFKNVTNSPLYACSQNGNHTIPSNGNTITLPLSSAVLKEDAPNLYVRSGQAFFPFNIYDSNGLLGSILFRLIPKMVSSNPEPLLILEHTTFIIPTKRDVLQHIARPTLQEDEKKKLHRKIDLWNPNALSIIRSSEADLLERCSPIIQFLWSSKPDVAYPPPNVDDLSFIERLEGLENKDFPMLCGGFGRLFVEIVSDLMPDIKLRHINGFQCNYTKVFKNIHVKSHIFTEIFDNGHWIYVDPYLQYYFTDQSGQQIGVSEIRDALKTNRLDQLTPVYFPANPPPHFVDINGGDDLKNLLLEMKLFHCFHCFQCFQWIHCNEIAANTAKSKL